MKLKKIIFGIILLILLIAVIFQFHSNLKFLIENFASWAYPDDNNRNGEVIKLIMNIIAGIVVTFGLYATFLRARATQKSVEKQEKSIKNQTRQIKLSYKSQVNEQFKNAIEHLGTDKEPIILGGISELHSIAKENKEEYSDVISNIFTSYLRNEANIKKNAEQINKTIIQTMINYLLKTDIYSHKNINLTHCNFNSIDLNNISLHHSDFSFGILPWKLKNSKFSNCKFSKCEITLGRYKEVEFIDCELFNIKIRSSNFENSTFKSYKKLQLINCTDSEFTDCKFETSFYKSRFYACEFKDCKFSSSDLSNAEFLGSSFHNLEFPNNDIYQADFSGCGFYNVLSKNIILKSKFNGLKSDTKYYSHFFEKQIEKSSLQEADLSGFKYDQINISKCEFQRIDEVEKHKILNKYQKLAQNEDIN